MERFISKKNPDTGTLLFDKTRTAVNASKQWHSYHILFNWDSNVNIFLHCIGMSFLFWKIQMFIVNWEQIWGTRKKHPMASWKCVIFLVRTNVIPMMKQYVFSTSRAPAISTRSYMYVRPGISSVSLWKKSSSD
jgi:hypothetical protein